MAWRRSSATRRTPPARGVATDAGGPVPEAVPLEWAGIVRPFTEDEVASLDRVLGLEAPVGASR